MEPQLLVLSVVQAPRLIADIQARPLYLGDEQLACDACGQISVVTFWRFEGLSIRCDRTEAGRHEPLPNSRH
jgi:hypothetical protein